MAEEQSMEEIRRKKMAEAYQTAQAKAAQDEQLRSALGNMLEPAAYERLMLVKMSNPTAFSKVVQAIAYLQQAGQLKGRLNEAQIRALLVKMTARKTEPKITILHKGGNERKSGEEQARKDEGETPNEVEKSG
jgi:programmed cell death protein 5